MESVNLETITIAEARRLLDNKEVSAVELTKNYLDRIKNFEKKNIKQKILNDKY